MIKERKKLEPGESNILLKHEEKDAIKRALRRHSITQEQAASDLGMDRNGLCMILGYKSRLRISSGRLVRLYEITGHDPSLIFIENYLPLLKDARERYSNPIPVPLDCENGADPGHLKDRWDPLYAAAVYRLKRRYDDAQTPSEKDGILSALEHLAQGERSLIF